MKNMKVIAQVVKQKGFMNIREDLEDMGYGVDYSHSPYPHYRITAGRDSIVVISAKYVEDPDMVVDGIAIGKMASQKQAGSFPKTVQKMAMKGAGGAAKLKSKFQELGQLAKAAQPMFVDQASLLVEDLEDIINPLQEISNDLSSQMSRRQMRMASTKTANTTWGGKTIPADAWLCKEYAQNPFNWGKDESFETAQYSLYKMELVDYRWLSFDCNWEIKGQNIAFNMVGKIKYIIEISENGNWNGIESQVPAQIVVDEHFPMAIIENGKIDSYSYLLQHVPPQLLKQINGWQALLAKAGIPEEDYIQGRYASKKEASYLTLVPAYGRDYKSKKAVIADWEADKDFLVRDMMSPYDGKAINKSDAKRAGIQSVNIRFKQMRSVAVIKV